MLAPVDWMWWGCSIWTITKVECPLNQSRPNTDQDWFLNCGKQMFLVCTFEHLISFRSHTLFTYKIHNKLVFCYLIPKKIAFSIILVLPSMKNYRKYIAVPHVYHNPYLIDLRTFYLNCDFFPNFLYPCCFT